MLTHARARQAGEHWETTGSATDVLVVARLSGGRLVRGITAATAQYSDDDGYTWTNCTNAPTGVHDLLVTPSGRIVACSYLAGQGISYSDDNGVTWTAASGVPSASFHFMARNPNTGRIVTNRSLQSYHMYSDDNGASWTSVSTANQYWYFVLWVGDRFLSLSGQTAIVLSSADGSSWTQVADITSLVGGTSVWVGQWVYSKRTRRIFLTFENTTKILVSDDLGVTWTYKDVGFNYTYAYKLAFLEDSGRVVLQNSRFAGSGFSLFSDDNGETWSRTSTELLLGPDIDSKEFGLISAGNGHWRSRNYLRMGMFPGSRWVPKSVFALSWRSVCEHPRTGTLVAAVSSSSVYASNDGGETWPISAGTAGTADSVDFDGVRNRFIIGGASFYAHSTDGASWTTGASPSGNTQAIIATSSGALIAISDSNAQYSTDGGNTWSGAVSYGGPSVVRVGAHIASIGRTVVIGYSGSSRVSYTDDNGATWTAVNVPALGWRGICFIPSAKRLVAVSYVASTQGIMISDDYGATWRLRYLPSAVQLVSVKHIPGFDIVVAVGISGARSFISYDQGLSWHTCSLADAENWFELCWSRVRKRLLAFAQTGTNRLQVSNGHTWEWPVKLVQQRSATINNLYDVIVLDNGRYLAVIYSTGTGKFMYSDDRGVSWVLCSVTGAGEGTAAIDCGGGVVVGLTTTAILRSTDYGSTWTEVASGVFAKVGRLCRKASNGYLFAGCSLPAGDAKIMRSTDNGLSWSTVFAGASGSGNVRAIAADENSGNIVAAVENGTLNIMYSTDNGGTWTQVPHGQNGAQKNRWLRAFYDAPRKRILLGAISLISGTHMLLASSDGGVNWTALTHAGQTAQGFCIGPADALFIAGYSTASYTKTGSTAYPNLVEVAQKDVSNIVGLAYDPAINRLVTCSSGLGTLNNIQTADLWDTIQTASDFAVILGESYRTVRMPDGKEWMAVNLAWSGSGRDYNDSVANRAVYGRLYTWEESNALPLSNGWRVPSEAEYLALAAACGGAAGLNQKLRSTSSLWTDAGYAGLNTYGFNGMPSGQYYTGDSAPGPGYRDLGLRLFLWTSTPASGYYGRRAIITNAGDAFAVANGGVPTTFASASYSIRLVRDIA